MTDLARLTTSTWGDDAPLFDLKGALMDCGIAERSARRMMNGQVPMAPGLTAELAVVVRSEARRLDAMAEALERDAQS